MLQRQESSWVTPLLRMMLLSTAELVVIQGSVFPVGWELPPMESCHSTRGCEYQLAELQGTWIPLASQCFKVMYHWLREQRDPRWACGVLDTGGCGGLSVSLPDNDKL